MRGTFACAAKMTSPLRVVGPAGGGRKGSVASAKRMGTDIRPASSVNSRTSRFECTTNRSVCARCATAFRVAGTEIPGSPLTNTGRRLPAPTIDRMTTFTSGPRSDSSTTSGRSFATRAHSSSRLTTAGLPMLRPALARAAAS